VVVPFVLHLAAEGQMRAALQALERVKRTLRAEPGSRLEVEIAELTARLKGGNSAKKSPAR
jgi:hypothetical protein